jgi:hypothetical protein
MDDHTFDQRREFTPGSRPTQPHACSWPEIVTRVASTTRPPSRLHPPETTALGAAYWSWPGFVDINQLRHNSR